MLQVEHVSSLDGPNLAPYRTMRQQREQWQQGIFVAEGEKVVRRLIESRHTVVSVLMPEHWLKQLESQLQARPENIRGYVADKKLLEELTGFTMYQGLLAVGKVPAKLSLSELLPAAASPRLLVAVDSLTNAENLGALVRNCVAFGAQAMLVGETSNSPYLRRAVRSSMWAIFELPVVELTCLAQTLRQLQGQGIRCVAAHPHTDRRTVAQADLARDCCLIFGSEGYGISAAVLAQCDEAVAILMRPGVDSLNVGSAGAVFLYEASRQRGRM